MKYTFRCAHARNQYKSSSMQFIYSYFTCIRSRNPMLNKSFTRKSCAEHAGRLSPQTKKMVNLRYSCVEASLPPFLQTTMAINMYALNLYVIYDIHWAHFVIQFIHGKSHCSHTLMHCALIMSAWSHPRRMRRSSHTYLGTPPRNNCELFVNFRASVSPLPLP